MSDEGNVEPDLVPAIVPNAASARSRQWAFWLAVVLIFAVYVVAVSFQERRREHS